MTAVRDDELLIERAFDAPVALVFRLWEDRDHLLRWWGPEEFTAVELDWQLTPGRPWRGAMASKQYGLSRFGGVIREVETDRRIVFTFRWDEDDEGRYPDTQVTVTFAERDGRTIQSVPPDAVLERRDPRQPRRRMELALQQAAALRREHRHRRSRRECVHDHADDLRMGAGLRRAADAGVPRPLGAGGGRPALPGAHRGARAGAAVARASGPPALRPGAGDRGGRARPVRERRDRAPHRREERGAAAARPRSGGPGRSDGCSRR